MQAFLTCISWLGSKLLLTPMARTSSPPPNRLERQSSRPGFLLLRFPSSIKHTLLQSVLLIETILIVKYTNKAFSVVHQPFVTVVWLLTKLRNICSGVTGTPGGPRPGASPASSPRHGTQRSRRSEGTASQNSSETLQSQQRKCKTPTTALLTS